MEILHWPVDEKLKKEAEENYRTAFALKLKNETPLDIIRKLSFDGIAPNITIEIIENLFNSIEKKFLRKKLSGVGVDAGAGPLTFAAILAKKPDVCRVYGVEICQPIIEVLASKVSDFILGDKTNKVIGVVGDFNEIKLPDESVDFIFDYVSFHHSDNLESTMKECKRILKRGGFVLCFDRGRPDFYTQEDLNELLDVEYPEAERDFFGWPRGKFTRRMNGEKEYRLKDWKNAFLNVGFSKFQNYYLARATGNNIISRTVKSLLSHLPPMLQLKVNKFLPPPKFNHKFILSAENRIFCRFLNEFPREISLMIAYK